MIKRLGVLGVSVALALLVGPALANDSTAELRAGGLVLTRTNNIEMRSEDLFISAAQVRVTYRFFNRSSSPVTTQVAFPMPEITVEGPDENISIPLPNSANFLGFSTTVDGRPVTARLEQRVFVRGAEQTDRLRRLGIPLMPLSSRTSLALERLPRAQQEELIRLGLAVVNAYDQGRGMERHLQATWTLRTTYHWQQTFPPGREITVAHRYRPAVGATAGTGLNNADYLSREEGRDSVRRYCVDEPFLAAVRRVDPGTNGFLMENRIAYVLTTGANWAGPIGDFRMVVDKGSAANLVSFCGQGVRRISPTQFEVRHRNYTPSRDVDVLVINRQAPGS